MKLKNLSFVISELKFISNKALIEYKEVEALKFIDKIVFDHVGFTYPQSVQQILKDISFELKKGETIGFIGASGSGKTTLLNIFLRFMIENTGNITIDGIKLSQENRASFQKTIGFVQQDVYIKNGTLIENIAFGEEHEDVDDEKVNKAIKDSMLTDLVNQHPDKLEMFLGENGVRLSGGQKQRVGIARALYKDAQILLFDEATSALDPETEKEIVATINHLAKMDRTIVIVAHRVTTLEMCDRIYELKEGKIKNVYGYEAVLKKVMG